MRMLVVGAGATGGYFGGRLFQAGRDVTFLVRAARAEQLRSGGLHIESPHGSVVLTPKLTTARAIAEPYDVVLVAVKAPALAGSVEDFAPAVGPDTMIVPLQNGVRHIETLASRFGPRAVIGGLCNISATCDEEGRIWHLAGTHDLVYGEMDGSVSPRVERLDVFLKGAGFDARLSTSIAADIWDKWILMAALGGVTCLMRGYVGEIAAVPGGIEFANGLVDEIVATTTAQNHCPSAAWVDFVRSLVTAKETRLVPSMQRDVLKRLPIEADQIVGDLLARAQAAGVSTPRLAAVYANLCVFQNRMQPGGAAPDFMRS